MDADIGRRNEERAVERKMKEMGVENWVNLNPKTRETIVQHAIEEEQAAIAERYWKNFS